MKLETFGSFEDFELLDSGNGYRLERWGEVILQRPDPQIIWSKSLPENEWDKAWAVFSNRGLHADTARGLNAESIKGKWDIRMQMPKQWILHFKNIKLLLKLSPFKHTGVFAEQAANWEWALNKIQSAKFKMRNEKPKILNLFGYTGGATMALAKAGCQVTHVDASKPAITWANENFKLNKLPPDSVRWILDDAAKFAKRELKRGTKYDGIIMDPPAYGHSPTGKTWKFNEGLPELLNDCVQLLSSSAKFLIVNGYATNSSALALNNLLEDATQEIKGTVEFGELCLKQKNSRLLSTGIFARWSTQNL